MTDLTPEGSRLRDEVREFARREIGPLAAEIDEQGRFPVETFRKMADLGFLGIPVPREYGGRGADLLSFMFVLEEVASFCASTALGLSVHTSLATLPILAFGNKEQKRKYLPEMASGRKLGAFGLTESHAGSDAAAIRTRASKEGRFYVLNGSKAYTTNATQASFFLVTARTSGDPGPRGISSFIVEKGFPGFSVGEKENKLGFRASDTAEIYFEDCRVPAENLLGGEGEGFRNFMEILDGGRIGISAIGIGIARAALEECVTYVHSREVGGRLLAEQGAIREKVADMEAALHTSRLLVCDAARRRMEGKPHTKEAAITKLVTSEACYRVTKDAVQILGADGCSRDYRVERLFRDAKLLEIGEGTSEIQRLIISRQVLSGERQE